MTINGFMLKGPSSGGGVRKFLSWAAMNAWLSGEAAGQRAVLTSASGAFIGSWRSLGGGLIRIDSPLYLDAVTPASPEIQIAAGQINGAIRGNAPTYAEGGLSVIDGAYTLPCCGDLSGGHIWSMIAKGKWRSAAWQANASFAVAGFSWAGNTMTAMAGAAHSSVWKLARCIGDLSGTLTRTFTSIDIANVGAAFMGIALPSYSAEMGASSGSGYIVGTALTPPGVGLDAGSAAGVLAATPSGADIAPAISADGGTGALEFVVQTLHITVTDRGTI